MKALVATVLGLALSITALAAPPSYDESADAHADLQRALEQAQREQRDVLILFGANWCEDCRDLDSAMRGSSAALIQSHFILVKIDVGNFNRNLDLVRHYRDPIRGGIPAAVVVSPADQLLYVTRPGELAHARRLGPEGIYSVFSQVVAGLN
jgi:thioredoxin